MSGWLPGVILIVVGLTLFAVQLLDLDADVIVLIIGLGTGIVLEDFRVMREPVVLGLGLGFLAIYVVDVITSGARAQGRWWPLIPGAILTAVAGASGAFGEEGERAIERGWPILLVVAGAWLLLRGRVSA